MGKPGRPFWTGFTAFFSNMVVLLGLDAVGVTENVDRTIAVAVVASFIVAGAVYGRERLSDAQRESRHENPEP